MKNLRLYIIESLNDYLMSIKFILSSLGYGECNKHDTFINSNNALLCYIEDNKLFFTLGEDNLYGLFIFNKKLMTLKFGSITNNEINITALDDTYGDYVMELINDGMIKDLLTASNKISFINNISTYKPDNDIFLDKSINDEIK